MKDYVSKLHDAISSNQAIIGVVGLGYVGLPLASALHSGGLTVLGFDVDESKIASLEQGRNYLKHLGATQFYINAVAPKVAPKYIV